MKHSGLVKLMAVLLAVISLSLLVSGFYGMHSAAKDRGKREEEISQLQNTVDDYRTVTARLMDTDTYDSMSKELEEQKKQYDELLTHHRKELATYTATNGGLETGADALAQAEAALSSGKTQLEAGKQQLETQAQAFEQMAGLAVAANALLEDSIPVLDALQIALDSAKRLAESLHRIGEIMELPENTVTENSDNMEAMRVSALEACDTSLELYDDAVTITEMLRDRELSTEMIRDLLESAGIRSGDDLARILEENGIPLTDDQRETLDRLMNEDSVVLVRSEDIESFLKTIEETSGMTMDELLTRIRNGREALAAGDTSDLELNEYQFGTVRRAYTDNQIQIWLILTMMENMIPDIEDTVLNAREQIAEAQNSLGQIAEAKETIDQGRAALDEAEAQLAFGEQTLKQGSSQMEEMRKKQTDKAEELETEKRELSRMEKEVARLTEETELQKELEDKERSLRLTLLIREEIRQQTDGGEELLPAAEGWLSNLKQETKQNYRQWFGACLLMILGSILAIMGIPSALGEKRSGILLFPLTVFCLLCVDGALGLLLNIGRGISYSALVTGALAILQMALLLFELARSVRGLGHKK